MSTRRGKSPVSGTVRIGTVPGYGLNELRTPAAPLIHLEPTASQTSGPYFPPRLVDPEESNLAFMSGHATRAEGELISVTGRVLGEDGNALRYALVEIWQANRHGKYRHPVDDEHEAPLDDNFRGFGRCLTDSGGQYRFFTIKPGPYPVPTYQDWMRPPHIHFSVFGAGVMQRLITQMYFAGEPLNDVDMILNAVSEQVARDRLIVSPSRTIVERGENCDEYVFDIVLRGTNETPFFDE
ncbi:protocatechuate 3,4-dioxygenase subunit alpha [Pseudolabrys sp.]|uniref:protocatechuate 3,4-dioxygenase subunit alpha n=1 Tax=Pseudolabrys sp. TaxID=1960880 RepID=UPI003D11D254